MLLVDRVYLRQSLDAFASLSFRIGSTSAPWVTKQRKRFWAKLEDANQMQIAPPAGAQRELAITLRPNEIVARARACALLRRMDNSGTPPRMKDWRWHARREGWSWSWKR